MTISIQIVQLLHQPDTVGTKLGDTFADLRFSDWCSHHSTIWLAGFAVSRLSSVLSKMDLLYVFGQSTFLQSISANRIGKHKNRILLRVFCNCNSIATLVLSFCVYVLRFAIFVKAGRPTGDWLTGCSTHCWLVCCRSVGFVITSANTRSWQP